MTENSNSAYTSKDYLYSIMWSEEDDSYVARVLELPSLAAHGPTSEEALREMRSLVDAVLEDLIESDEPIPEPLGRRQFSGKLNLRMAPKLHRQLSIEAAREGVSLNHWITIKLAGETASQV